MAWGFYSWGSMDLLVAKGSYNPPASGGSITEISLIPGPETERPESIIQEGSRLRERVSFQGYATKIDYESLKSDKDNKVERVFTDIEGVTMNAVIDSLESKWLGGPYPYFYSIALLEV